MGNEKKRQEGKHGGHYFYVEKIGDNDKGSLEQRFDGTGKIMDVNATYKKSKGRKFL